MSSVRSSLLQSLVLRSASSVFGVAAVMFSLGVPQQAQAAVLQVSPVRIQFEPSDNAQALNVFNNGQQGLEAQVRVLRWTQENGEDKLVPATEVVASPAIMKVAPGGRQVVRLVRLHPSPPQHDASYRVLVDELPSKENSQGVGLKVLLRYSIPVFISATPVAPPASRSGTRAPEKTDLNQVTAQLAPAKGGGTELYMSNSGVHAIRISSLAAVGANGQSRMVVDGLVGYVLPGAQMNWPVKLPYPLPAGLTLKARFNDDTEAQTVPLAGAGR